MQKVLYFKNKVRHLQSPYESGQQKNRKDPMKLGFDLALQPNIKS